MAKREKSSLYLLSIVAVVGIVILVFNTSTVSFSSQDYAGKATVRIGTFETCEYNQICEQGESKLCRDCRWIYCNINDVCEGQEDARCSDCHFTASWYCDHDGICESSGYPSEPTTGECDDCP